MPTQTQLINHVRFIDRVIKNKTNGLIHADSMKQLPFPANCMNWNLGHLLVYRMQYLGVIDGTSKPSIGVCPVLSWRAVVLGRYLSSAIAASTRASVALPMRLPRPLSTFDTVLVETPAWLATS